MAVSGISVFRRLSIRRAGAFQQPKDISFGRRPRGRRSQPSSFGGRPTVRGGAGDVSLEGRLDKDLYRQENCGSAVASAEPAAVSSPEELAEREAELTASVPDLLDQMNSAAKENNKLKVELSRAKDRYDKRDKQLKQLYEEMRREYGQAVDQAEPYFKATQELTTVSHRVHTAVGEFKAAAARYCQAKADLKELEDQSSTSLKDVDTAARQTQGSDVLTISKALEKVEKTREERDLKETAYANALQDYRAAQEVAEAQRAQVGDATIRAAQPGFRRLHTQQSELSAEKVHMDIVEAKSETARSVYSETLVELDRISNAVRLVQQEFARRSACVTGDSSDSNCGSQDGFSDPTALAPELPVCAA